MLYTLVSDTVAQVSGVINLHLGWHRSESRWRLVQQVGTPCGVSSLQTQNSSTVAEIYEVIETVQKTIDSCAIICDFTSLTCLKYGFPNSPDSSSLQLSPQPGGVWAEDSLSSAALLLRAILSSCCGERGAGRGLDGSGSTAEDFCFFCKILVYFAKHKAGEKKHAAAGETGFKKKRRQCIIDISVVAVCNIFKQTRTQRCSWTQLRLCWTTN